MGDYDHVMRKWGSEPITAPLIERFQRLTGRKASPLLRRNIFYCHRDFDKILDQYEARLPFYIYTGRGPSTDSLHIGHAVPFMLCQQLQEAFDQCPVVIQLSDDEKFLYRGDLALQQCQSMADQNGRDVMAFGFDPKNTLLFSNTSSAISHLYPVMLRLQKHLNLTQVRRVFGLDGDDRCSVGQIVYPTVQMAPCFSASFPHLFPNPCPALVVYAIDQDPYFRLARDLAGRLGLPKPATLAARFLPGLGGCVSNEDETAATGVEMDAAPNLFGGKMSSSQPNSAIFMDDPAETVRQKILRHAYSAGQPSLELHRQLGVQRIHEDVAYSYLEVFLDNDQEMAQIKEDYTRGLMTSRQVKERAIEVLVELLHTFQLKRQNIA